MKRDLCRWRAPTPNVPEAERITGLTIRDEEGMRRAALRMREMGARAVLVKGGHLTGRRAVDLLDDEGQTTTFSSGRIETTATHGTGCTLAAGIAACLARGMSLEASVGAAKLFVTEAIRRAPDGRGHGHHKSRVPVRLEAGGGEEEALMRDEPTNVSVR